MGAVGCRDDCSSFGPAPGSVSGVLMGREGHWLGGSGLEEAIQVHRLIVVIYVHCGTWRAEFDPQRHLHRCEWPSSGATAALMQASDRPSRRSALALHWRGSTAAAQLISGSA